MAIQQMGGDPMQSFATGFNIGSQPNALGTAILTAMDKYEQNKLQEQEMGQAKELAEFKTGLEEEKEERAFPREVALAKAKQGFKAREASKERMGELREEKLKEKEKRRTLQFKKRRGLGNISSSQREIISLIRKAREAGEAKEEIIEAIQLEGFDPQNPLFQKELEDYKQTTPSSVKSVQSLIKAFGGGLL